MAENDEGFLTRWSRRKEEARRGQEPSAAPAEGAPDAAGAASPTAVPGAAGAQTEGDDAKLVESLPDVDSMTLDSDFSAFLHKNVPATLRRQALRKLWRLDPVFANLDGLNDYDEDYTKLGMVPAEGLRSLYQVGKGMPGAEPEPVAEQAEATEPPGEEQMAPEGPDQATADTGAEDGEPRAAEPEVIEGDAEGRQREAVPAPDLAEQGAEEARQTAGRPESGGAAARRWGRFST